MTALFVWAGRGLSGRERRIVWAGLAVAVGIRVLSILIAWSVTALKEALYVFLCAVALWAAAKLIHGPGTYARAAAMALLAGAIAANGSIRDGGSGIMVAGLGAGMAARLVLRRAGPVGLVMMLLPLPALGPL